MNGTFLSPHDSRSTLLAILLCLGLAAGLATGLGAEVFVEDFSSLEHCDVGNTTACWDTEAGKLRLHPYPMNIEASIDVSKFAFCFARSGDYVYLGVAGSGIQVLDISNIHQMEYVGEWLMVEDPKELWVDGDRLYLADFHRFLVIDISDPTDLEILGESTEVSQVTDVAVSGDRAYLSSITEGFYCLDISNPEKPVLIGQVGTPSSAQSVTLYGDHAYLCARHSGFFVIDISDPTQPLYVNQVPASYYPESIHIAGGLAYVAEISGELLIYSLVDPAAPLLIGACDLPGDAMDVVVSGKLAYLTIFDADIKAICAVDVGDPTQPRLLNSTVLADFYPKQLELFGEFALVNSFSIFLAVRIADQVPPSPAGEVTGPSIFGFVADGTLAYALTRQSGDELFQTVSLADPEQPVLLGSCDLIADPLDLALAPPYAYVASFGRGLEVVDIHDPAQPQVACTMNLDRTGVSVEPFGDYLFLGYIDGGVGLMTLDISDPTNPVPVSELPLEYPVHDMCRSGDYLYTIQWEDGCLPADPAPLRDNMPSDIMVLDISDPTAPVPVTIFTVQEAWMEYLYIDGDLLYASFWTYLSWYGNGFMVFDISDPANPLLLSRWEDGAGLGQIVLSGDLAYRAGGYQIDVLDVSDPSSPFHLHSMQTDRETRRIDIGGDHLFYSCGYGGLRSVRVYDRSADILNNLAQSLILPATETPLSYVRMAAVATPSVSWEFSADAGEHWQFLPAPDDWLSLDYPGSEPRWRATLLYTEIGEPPVVDELSLEWVSDLTSISDAEAPAVFALHPATPNPFNPATSICFDLPRPCHARLEVFDVAGRRVRRLVDSELPAGPHQVSWDGRDGAGTPLGSGIYACRLYTGDFEQSQKLVLIK